MILHVVNLHLDFEMRANLAIIIRKVDDCGRSVEDR